MERKIKESLGLLWLILAWMIQPVSADEITFSVSPIFNGNQTENVADYYDMSLSRDSMSEIGIKIKNQDTAPHDYQLSIENAFSNRNGIIEYTAKPMTYHQIPALSAIATAPSTIHVEAKSETVVPIELVLPKEPFEGTTLGGVRVRKTDDKEESGQVVNRYSYLIPVKIHQGNQDYPEEILFKGAALQVVKYDSNLEIVFENVHPVVLKGMNVQVTMKRMGQTQAPIQTLYDDEVRMAPETVNHMLLRLNQEEVKAGKYLVTIEAKGKEFHQTWTEELEIKASEAKTINENIDMPKKEPSKMWLFVVIILILLLIILIQMIVIGRRRKRNERQI
ncbi:WxL protein peptidoglycan domain-containing protein [Vagococcus lutrae]|uniref:WxL protein peptidoglycan domain-containing protein n=1 Tax=Vagococcus lutrae TaxID=81947 RepID=UPI0023A9925E|nr:DUF916 domain-containing protein [Vagococcus lutrae]WEB81757.1 DUF916 and DUF3324 domain-containing protein [Vagococcus lutrae]